MQGFYDPDKTFDDNFDNGPFFDEIPPLIRDGEPAFNFLGHPIYLPFGIGAGPLPTSKHVSAAFKFGYDVVHYKTQRSYSFGVNEFPNVIPVESAHAISLEEAEAGLTKAEKYPENLAELVITNSFGNPSRGPEFWQEDMKKAVESAGKGQVLIASAVGSIKDGFSEEDYWDDFAHTALLCKEASAPIVEINLSCPNVASEGVICYNQTAVMEIVRRTKESIGNTPLLIKLGYFAPKQQELLEDIVMAVEPFVAGIASINTLTAAVRNRDGTQALPGEGRLKSGLCGAGIKWAGLDMVRRLSDIRADTSLEYSIIGVGGVMQPADYFAYRELGADVVQSCTAPMWHPGLAHEIMGESKLHG